MEEKENDPDEASPSGCADGVGASSKRKDCDVGDARPQKKVAAEKEKLMTILNSSLKMIKDLTENPKKVEEKEDDDEDDLFVKSISKTLKKMTKKNKKLAKAKILAIVLELDDSE